MSANLRRLLGIDRPAVKKSTAQALILRRASPKIESSERKRDSDENDDGDDSHAELPHDGKRDHGGQTLPIPPLVDNFTVLCREYACVDARFERVLYKLQFRVPCETVRRGQLQYAQPLAVLSDCAQSLTRRCVAQRKEMFVCDVRIVDYDTRAMPFDVQLTFQLDKSTDEAVRRVHAKRQMYQSAGRSLNYSMRDVLLPQRCHVSSCTSPRRNGSSGDSEEAVYGVPAQQLLRGPCVLDDRLSQVQLGSVEALQFSSQHLFKNVVRNVYGVSTTMARRLAMLFHDDEHSDSADEYDFCLVPTDYAYCSLLERVHMYLALNEYAKHAPLNEPFETLDRALYELPFVMQWVVFRTARLRCVASFIETTLTSRHAHFDPMRVVAFCTPFAVGSWLDAWQRQVHVRTTRNAAKKASTTNGTVRVSADETIDSAQRRVVHEELDVDETTEFTFTATVAVHVALLPLTSNASTVLAQSEDAKRYRDIEKLINNSGQTSASSSTLPPSFVETTLAEMEQKNGHVRQFGGSSSDDSRTSTVFSAHSTESDDDDEETSLSSSSSETKTVKNSGSGDDSTTFVDEEWAIACQKRDPLGEVTTGDRNRLRSRNMPIALIGGASTFSESDASENVSASSPYTFELPQRFANSPAIPPEPESHTLNRFFSKKTKFTDSLPVHAPAVPPPPALPAVAANDDESTGGEYESGDVRSMA